MVVIQSRNAVLAAVALSFASSASWADLSAYSQDFEALDQLSPTALGDDGWLVFGNVFTAGGDYLYGYGSFPAPNNPDAPAFSLIGEGQGGADQGAQQLVVFNDYNNTNHFDGSMNRIEANLYQEQNIGSADLGTTWRFGFDVKRPPEFGVEGDSIAAAFIKVLDSVSGSFNLLAFAPVETTEVGELWNRYSIDILIDRSWEGQLLQFGFLTVASNGEASGLIYDNVTFSAVPVPGALLLLASGLAGLAGFRRRQA